MTDSIRIPGNRYFGKRSRNGWKSVKKRRVGIAAGSGTPLRGAYVTSSSPKGSPHWGQNFGGHAGFAGSQPHLSHLYWSAPAGFLAPHWVQNRPRFTAPQTQVQPSKLSGFLQPHWAQKFPPALAPHFGQVQVDGAGFC